MLFTIKNGGFRLRIKGKNTVSREVRHKGIKCVALEKREQEGLELFTGGGKAQVYKPAKKSSRLQKGCEFGNSVAGGRKKREGVCKAGGLPWEQMFRNR